MSNTLHGVPPKSRDGKHRIAAIHIPNDMKAEIENEYRKQGWSNLVWARPQRQEDDDEPE